MTYQIVLIIHLFSAIVFIGTVYFRTLVMEPLTKGDLAIKHAHKKTGQNARFFAKIAVVLLFFSGLWLFLQHSHTVLLDIKATLAIITITLFFFAPKLTNKFKSLSTPFHYLMLTLMISIVILSKIWFF